MKKVDIIVDTLDEYWDLKMRMQSTVSKDLAEDGILVKVNEDNSSHIFGARKLEEGKYVYYEEEKEFN